MLCVSGSRHAREHHLDIIIPAIDNFIAENNITYINVGDAKGVDELVYNYYLGKISIEKFTARWDLYGNAAGPKRNREMLERSNYLIAFPDPSSRGTISAINIARELGIPVTRINITV